MRTSESTLNIAKALAAAQGVMKNPEANEKVVVKMKEGGSYEYSYATLPKCFDALRDPFKANGLQHSSFVGYNEKGQLRLTVRITHESGEFYESEMLLNGTRASKDLAGDITFWKRYLLNGMAGIAGDDDIRTEDGDSGPPRQQNNKPAQQKQNPPANLPKPKEGPAGKPANTAPQQGNKSAEEKAKPAAPAPAAKATGPTPFDQAEAPPLKGEPAKQQVQPRLRGQIVREIMAVAKALRMGENVVPPIDVMTALEVEGQEMFQKPLQDLADAQLEEMLKKLNNDMGCK